MDRQNLTLLTDLYELTMMQGYFRNKEENNTVIFDAFFRNNPFGGGYSIMCGIEQLVKYIKELHFSKQDIDYLRGQRWVIGYRVIYIVATLLGSIVELGIVWNFADCMNALMAIPNLISLLFLSGIIVSETRKYLWSGQLDREMEQQEYQITA